MFPPSLQWVPWPPRAGPCGSPPSRVLWGRTTAPPSVHGHLWFPLAAGTSVRRREGALLGSWRIPVEACPELETPAAPYVLALPAVRVQPSARITASASATIRFRSC